MSAPLLRTSERTTFKRCMWQWDRNYNDRIKPRQSSPPLRFGTLIHKALEKRYPVGVRRGPHPARTFEKLYAADIEEVERVWGFRDSDEEWGSALEIGVNMMEKFVDHYGKDEEWRVLGSELTFKVPVRDGGRRPLFYYVGTLDLVVQHRVSGRVRIWDWKTTKSDPTKEAQGLTLNEQASAYWTWGVEYLRRRRLLKPKQLQALDGMVFSFMRKAKPDDREQNAKGQYLNKRDGSVSKKQPPPMFLRTTVYRGEEERRQAAARAVQEFYDMEAVRNGERVAYKTPGSPPNSHCGWCGYRDICELHETGADWQALRDATMEEWDPYAAHEIAEEGKKN